MGYRDDLIAQFKEAGQWAKLTGEQQGEFERLTDQEAAALMVWDDELVRLEPEAIQETVPLLLTTVNGLFKGSLCSREEGYPRNRPQEASVLARS